MTNSNVKHVEDRSNSPPHISKDTKVSVRLVALLSTALALVYLTVTVFVGPRTGNDTWTYAAWGDVLRANQWNLTTFQAEIDFRAGTEILRVAAASVFGILAAVLGDGWLTGYLAFNWVALSATSAIMLLSLRRLGFERSGLVVAALFMGVLWEHVYWVAVVYTDISFNLFLSGVFALIVVGFTAASKGRRRFAVVCAFLLALLAVSYRPTALWLIGALGVAFVAGVHRIPARSESPRAVVLRVTGLGCFIVFAAWIGASIVLANANQLPASFFKEMVLYVDQFFQSGVVVRSRPETFGAPPEGAADYALLIAKKFIYYFKFSADGFGWRHNLYNWLTFVPFYGLALIGVASLAFPSSRITALMRAIGLLSLIWTIFFAFAHAVTIIDFDWRYRLPVYAPLAVLAAIGFRLIRESVFDWLAHVKRVRPERTIQAR